MADACSFSADHPPARCDRCPAAIHRTGRSGALFCAADRPVVHTGDLLRDSASLGAAGALACAARNRLRRDAGHGTGVRHWRERELLHLALSTGDYRGEHFVFEARDVSGGGFELRVAGRDGRAGLLRGAAANGGGHAARQNAADLDSEQPAGLCRRRLFVELADAEPPAANRRTRK